MNVAFLTFRCIYNGYIDAMLVFSPLLFISRHTVPLTPETVLCRFEDRYWRAGSRQHVPTRGYVLSEAAVVCIVIMIHLSIYSTVVHVRVCGLAYRRLPVRPRCVSVRRCKPSGKCGMRIVSSQRCVCLCLCLCVCSVTCPRISFPLWECYCILSSSQLGYDNKSNSSHPHVVLTQHIDTTHLLRFQNCLKYRVWRGKIPTKENLSSDVCFTTLLN